MKSAMCVVFQIFAYCGRGSMEALRGLRSERLGSCRQRQNIRSHCPCKRTLLSQINHTFQNDRLEDINPGYVNMRHH